jgi:hypothetical protein
MPAKISRTCFALHSTERNPGVNLMHSHPASTASSHRLTSLALRHHSEPKAKNPRIRSAHTLAALACILLTIAGCSSSTSSAAPADSLSLSLTSPFVTITPDGTVNTVIATATRSVGNSNSITLSATNLPTGVTVTFTQPGSGAFGTIFIAGSATTPAGVYPITITATDGTASSTAVLSATLDAVTIAPTAGTLAVRQDATPATASFTVAHTTGVTNSITVSASGLPTGLTAAFTQPGTGTTGSVTFTTASTPAAAGTYTVTLTASDGKTSGTTTLSVTIGVVLTVANATDTTIGLSGHLQQFMSTGFQPSTYNNSFFTSYPSTVTLTALNSKHIRLQPVTGAIPWTANSSPQATTDWSFTALDKTVQPILTVGDESPIFQIAQAPPFLNGTNGDFTYNSTNLGLLTTYAQNLVRYYNTGGFTYAGQHYQSPSSQHITWWAIFNEPNLNGITAAQYVTIYNTLVPAMLQVDPTLKFVALELSDYSGQPQAFLPTLVLPAASGGLNAQVNAFATHFYGTCMQTATDASLFTGVTQFATDVTYFYTEIAKRSDLVGVPVWVTENNVNSDYPLTTGYDSCTPTQLYVLDPRGTSTFFTAYRPLVFSRLGKAGNQSLYHFLYEGSLAYGEVNNANDATTIAYWTDYWLERTFPWDGVSTGAVLYKTTTTEPTSTVDVMATLNTDSSVSLMVTNYATAATTDDNGAGAPRTVYVNLAALGTFTTGTEVDLNASTSAATGPASKAITPSSTLTLNFTGYGSSMFILHH